MARRVTMQLYEGFGGFPFGDIIKASGGTVYVATADDASKATLTDKDGASVTNGAANATEDYGTVAIKTAAAAAS